MSDRYIGPLAPMRPRRALEREVRFAVGEQLALRGVTFVIRAVNAGKGRITLEMKQGKVRSEDGGVVCSEQVLGGDDG